MSHLGNQVDDKGELPDWAFFVADDAYVSGPQMVVPFGGKNLPAYKDSFNYYQSSLRIEVECTLGAVQARWGVLWRPLRCSLAMASLVTMACFCLHNICVDAGMPSTARSIALSRAHGDVDGAMRVRDSDGRLIDQDLATPPQLHPRFQSAGYHDLQDIGRGPRAPSAIVSATRNRIATHIHEAGYERPPPTGGARGRH